MFSFFWRVFRCARWARGPPRWRVWRGIPRRCVKHNRRQRRSTAPVVCRWVPGKRGPNHRIPVQQVETS